MALGGSSDAMFALPVIIFGLVSCVAWDWPEFRV